MCKNCKTREEESEILRKHADILKANIPAARKLLRKAGIIDSKGQLTSHYKRK